MENVRLKKSNTGIPCLLRLALLFCCAMAAFLIAAQYEAHAKSRARTVRVGWYESPFNIKDRFGRRSGYAYEYQQKIAAYTGWKYEYVEASWSELMDMLCEGKIDLLSDVSYTEERSRDMLFSALPMGTEEYYIFISPKSKDFTPNDTSYFDGKKIGVNRGSFQKDLFDKWAKIRGVHAEVVELDGSEGNAVKMLNTGKLDAYVTIDAYGDQDSLVPVIKIGSSDFYFAVRKERRDILVELDAAMNRIQDEDRFYNQQLFEKFVRTEGAYAFLNSEENDWLEDHGTIRVGYQDNYMAFCAMDKETGELTGALKDYLEHASSCLENANLDFAATAYPTADEALKALKKGEVDCMFPANLGYYDGEALGVIMTPSIMNSEVYAIVRSSEENLFSNKNNRVKVAVNQGNPNYETFLLDHFPAWKIVYFPDTPSGLRGVADGRADCLLVSNFRINNIGKLCDKYRLSSVATGVNIDYCFAVDSSQTELYSILSKAAIVVPDPTINSALTYYITEDARFSITDFINDNIASIIAVIIAIILVNIAFIRSFKAEKRANEGQQLISATETDSLTGLYNRSFFFEYANRMYMENPNKPMDAVVLNIERFHSVNELKGQEFGDSVLKQVGQDIREFLSNQKGIGGRFEADHFDIYCEPQNDYKELLDFFQENLMKISQNVVISLRMGVMPWQEGIEPMQLFDRARTASSIIRGSKIHLMVYDKEMQIRDDLNQRLINDLARGLRENEFRVYFQPKFEIQCDPPKLYSAEALIRWVHPELGLISPDDFIPLFEGNGQISEIDRYVWKETARQIARWREKYGITLPVSVNLSRVDALDPRLEDILNDIVAEYGLDHSSLNLEVTESAYTEDSEQLSSIIHHLREAGYEIEMDDFGSGYSSLNMLSSMAIDVLKMDRVFIRNIEHSEKDVRLVELILNIARNLKVPVIAEGVETKSQLELLKKLGCPLVQGYYFSPPLPSMEFEKKYLNSYKYF